MSLASNIDDVERQIQAIVDGFDFRRPGVEGSLARDLIATAAEAIIERSIPDALDPSGAPWPANEAKYAAYKVKYFEADQPGVLLGQMLSLDSMEGTASVAPHAIDWTYGKNVPPDAARVITAMIEKAAERHMQATDREKARWFTDGGRKFFELDDGIRARLYEVSREALSLYLREVT